MKLKQGKYSMHLLKNYKMENVKSSKRPIESYEKNADLSKETNSL